MLICLRIETDDLVGTEIGKHGLAKSYLSRGINELA